jgi:hypothetical protein
MRRRKIKLVLINLKYLKAYEAWVNQTYVGMNYIPRLSLHLPSSRKKHTAKCTLDFSTMNTHKFVFT